MARSNETGRLCSLGSLRVVLPPPLLVQHGIIGLSALFEATCGQSLTTSCTCFLSSNENTLHSSNIPTSGLASNGARCIFENGFSTTCQTTSRNSHYADKA